MDTQELYDKLRLAGKMIREDEEILYKITREMDILRKLFTSSQIRLLRYQISIDREYAKNDYENIEKAIYLREGEGMRRLFE